MEITKKIALILEVCQAAVFKLVNPQDERKDYLLNTYCLEVLFSYARETISALSQSAGFMPVILQPINFNEVYQQRIQLLNPNKVPSSEPETITLQ